MGRGRILTSTTRIVRDLSRHTARIYVLFSEFLQTPFKVYLLVHLRSLPLTLLASLIDPETLKPFGASPERLEFFESTTGMPYAPSTIIELSDAITIRCPCCVAPTQLHVPWWDPEGKGYAQPGFTFSCPECHKTFNKETMGVRRFCDEVALRRSGSKLAFSFVMFHSHIFHCLLTNPSGRRC